MMTEQRSTRAPVRAGGVLMVVAAVVFGCWSAVHAGITVPLGFTTVHAPDSGAMVPELVIGVVLLAGAIPVLARARYARLSGLLATGFAIAGTIVGLSITIATGRTGWPAHAAVIAFLVVTFALLAVRRSR